MRRSSVELEDALDEFDVTLDFFGIGKRIEKAKTNPLTHAGFDRKIIELNRKLRRTVGKPERAALKSMIGKLERDWRSMSTTESNKAIAAATASVGALGVTLALPVGDVVFEAYIEMTISTNVFAAAKFNAVSIIGSTDLVDNRVVRSVRTRQAFFVRNEYGVRQGRLSAVARSIVAKGTAEGFTSKAISEQLAAALGPAGINRSRSYYQSVASIYQARARSYGLLRGFADGGIDRFRFEAVLDTQTTEQCRFMHGRVFSVPRALQSFDSVASSGAESVYDLQPFMNVGRDNGGNSILYFAKGQGGDRQRVAQIDTPGVGKADTRGSYSRAMSGSRLESAGITTPPLHGRCRSTILAEV